MNLPGNSPLRFRPSTSCLQGILVAAALCATLVGQPAWADPYLAPGHPDGIALLPPPPLPGSGEEAAELAASRCAFQARTPAERARAIKDSGLSFALFEPAIGPLFRTGKIPKTEALLAKVRTEIGIVIDIPKDHYKRKRPYQLDKDLTLGDPEPSFGYPSGHSTRGTVYSLILAEIFPEKSKPILVIGRDIGWDRVLIGKHFTSDVQAGRVLGKAIVRELLASPSFQHDLAEAKAEVLALSNLEAPVETAR